MIIKNMFSKPIDRDIKGVIKVGQDDKRYDIFEVSKRIGHKSVKTTQDTYGHLFDEVQKSIANDLDGMRRR